LQPPLKTETVSTPYGPVRKKVGEGYGTGH